MEFEIKFFSGVFFGESEERAYDFEALLFNNHKKEQLLAKANGFFLWGGLEHILFTADINADTLVEGYISFLSFLEERNMMDDLHKVLVVERLDATTIGKGHGSKLLSHINHYALSMGVDHISLNADTKSEVDLDKYYEKVGFLKLPHNSWLYIVDEIERPYIKSLHSEFLNSKKNC